MARFSFFISRKGAKERKDGTLAAFVIYPCSFGRKINKNRVFETALSYLRGTENLPFFISRKKR
jgi:hypothetical protein